MSSSYRRKLDRHTTLPEVTFDIFGADEQPHYTKYDIDIMISLAEGLKIGSCALVISETRSHFDGIYLNKYWRGQGYGMAAYLLAIETAAAQSIPFESQDEDVSSSAKNIWLSLAHAGIAQMVEPFRPLGSKADGQEVFWGKYHVPLL